MTTGITNRSFLSLVITQFFGAANDNVLKIVLTFMVLSNGRWEDQLGSGGQGIIGLCFTIPFLLLSGYAGQFADRHSKRTVARLVKIVEIPIVIIAGIGFVTGSLWVTLGALILLTCQSSYFGPAKYGMIPELVSDSELSRANGIINMMTNVAVIIGSWVGGVVAVSYWPEPVDGVVLTSSPAPWLPAIVLIGLAIAGLLSVLFMAPLKPGDQSLRYDLNPFGTYIVTLREMAKTPMLMVTLAWGWFYLLAGIALFIVPEYAVVLKIPADRAMLLMAVLAVAIALGSVVAGFISGHRIEPRLVPVGAAGVTLFFLGLGLVPPTFLSVSILIGGAGFFSGFYLIPLQAALQHGSPPDERGRFLGTANAVSFAFLSLAAALYWVIRPAFGDEPQRIFLVSAALMLVGAGYFMFRLRHTLPNHLSSD